MISVIEHQALRKLWTLFLYFFSVAKNDFKAMSRAVLLSPK